MADSPPSPQSLTLGQAAELDALQKLVDAGKLQPGTSAWNSWRALVALKFGESPPSAASSPSSSSTPSSSLPEPASASVAPTLLKDWAAFYYPDSAPSSRIKAIDRLRALGKRVNHLPPLDRPDLMPEWFEEMRAQGHRPRGCPSQFLSAAARWSASPSPTAPAPASPGPQPSAPDPSPDPAPFPSPVTDNAPVTADETDPAAVLERLMADEARLSREYEALRLQNQPAAILDQARRRRIDAAAAVNAQRVHLEKHRHLVPLGSATAAYQRLIHPLPQLFLRAFLQNTPEPGEPWESTARRIIKAAWPSVVTDLRAQLIPA